MKRFFVLLSVGVACCTGIPSTLAGGWHGAGCWGGHGFYAGCWPFIGVGIGPYGFGVNICGIGIGFGGCYPAGGYCYSYPAYSYVSSSVFYSQPVYGHPVNQAYVSAAAPANYAVNRSRANPAYAPAVPASLANRSQPSSTPLPKGVVATKAQTPSSPVALAGRGAWIQDTSPDHYRPSLDYVPAKSNSRSYVNTAPNGQPPVYVAVR